MSQDIRKLCEEVLALDGLATKAPWSDPWLDSDEKSKDPEEVGIKSGDVTVCGVAYYDGCHFSCRAEDSRLITTYRNHAPTIARALLIALDCLEYYANPKQPGYLSAADKALAQIASLVTQSEGKDG